MTWTPVQKLSIGAGAALLVLSLFGIVAFAAVSRLAVQEAAVADANAAIARIDQLLAASADADRAGSEFILTGADDALEAFASARGRIEDALDVLRLRSEDLPRERAALDSLGPIIGQRLTTLNNGIAIRRRDGEAKAAAFHRDNPITVSRGGILPLIQRMREEESRVLGDRTRLQQQHSRTAATVILLASVFAFVLAALAFSPVRPSMAARLTKRLTTPVGIPAIPEFGESARDADRTAVDRLARIQQLALALDSPGNATAVGEAILTRGLSGVSSAASLAARFDGTAWHVVARRSTRAAVGSALTSDIVPPLADAARTREPVIIESQAERDRVYPGLPNFGGAAEVALLAIPMTANGRVAGALVIAFDGGRIFGDDERAYFATLGRLGGQALIRTQ